MLSPAPALSLSLTVYCASSKRVSQLYLDVAAELGRLIALRGHTLVYGGGNIGLMGALANAALAQGGKVRGVILADFIERGYGNSGHEMHSVDDMRARKRGLDEFGDAYIALPGGFGTLEEILEMISFKSLGFHHKPIVFINTNGYFDHLLRQFDRGFAEAFIHERFRDRYTVVTTPPEALDFIGAAAASEFPSPLAGEG
ncbi:MAG: TIGR00730 family Rossman fold protein [Deltaproteobacteria bacterium]|nr:TIGR00730 family Rossman fold protein [Deltaproteobacteria bacterium]